MSWFRSFTFLFVISTAIGYPDSENDILVRSPTLNERQDVCSTPGWIPACPGFFACVPPGAICCSDGYTYVMPPDTCPDGTQAVTTAGNSAPSPSAPLTTAAPTTYTHIIYTYYTTEFTWYYWYYYFTWIETYQTTTLASYQITTVTTVSVSATDDVQASLQFQSLSQTAVFFTPTQTATILSGTTPIQTPTSTPTPIGAPSTSLFNSESATASAKTGGEETISTTVTSISVKGGESTGSPSASSQVVAAGAGRVGGGLSVSLGGVWILGFLVMAPGFLMVWL